MPKFSLVKMCCLVAIFCVAGALAAPAQEFKTLVAFNNINNSPTTPVVQGNDGNLYGTNSTGGSNGVGLVYKLTPEGTLTTFYSFCSLSNCADGEAPNAGLVQGPDGDFYGTTGGGGANGGGTIFQLTPSGTLTTLYSFCSLANCADGTAPNALMVGSDGNLYGTTKAGGNVNSRCLPGGCGSAFEITTAGVFTTLYSFCSQAVCNDGAEPTAPLVQGTDGNFYGTTFVGGNTGSGTVFQLTPTGTLTTLYSFCSQQSDCADGSGPYAGLVQGADGNFYGTTEQGGTDPNHGYGGTVFQITTSGMLTTIYNFCSLVECADGQWANGLVLGTDGNFYGTTQGGGTPLHTLKGICFQWGCGTLYRLTPTGTLSTLWSFCSNKSCSEGALPMAPPIEASNGIFYSTTNTGGLIGNKDCCGTVFGWSANVFLAPTFTSASLKFGMTKLNTTSKPKIVTIRNVNTGYAMLNFSGFAANAPFAISTNTCGATLAAGKTCKVSITFTPTASGTSTGTLSVTDNAPGSPQTVSLSGTGD
jgi:uncharacterized repeat protein (TIGR03803 family)